MTGKVYFVATPIGNLGDITFRAVETLKNADYIACEDTRHSAILLSHYDIHKPTFSYHKFNENNSADGIIDLVNQGKIVAVISDAGMPIISDPGAVLARKLIEENLPFEVVPGASACVTALALSGLSNMAFTYGGFLPEKTQDRVEIISRLATAETTLIFYSACHNISQDLDDLFKILGARKVAVCNDITKKFELTIRGVLGEVEIENPRGEFVIVIEGVELKNSLNTLSIEEHIKYYLDTGVKRMEALKLVAKDRNLSKSEVYKHSLSDKN